MKKCPRCFSILYEVLKTYGHCTDCNFNTEESFSWSKKNEPAHSKFVQDEFKKAEIYLEKFFYGVKK